MAADDAADDAKENRCNPILCRYGTDIFEMRSVRTGADADSPAKEKLRLREDIAESLYMASLCSLARLEGAIALMDFTGVQSETEGILKNIAFLGMPSEMRRILALPLRKDALPGERT